MGTKTARPLSVVQPAVDPFVEVLVAAAPPLPADALPILRRVFSRQVPQPVAPRQRRAAA